MEPYIKCAKCSREARYYDRPTKLIYCKEHKTQFCYNFRDSKCIVRGCDGWQVYNFPGGRGLVCKKHSCKGMYNVNIVFKRFRCFVLDCKNMCSSTMPVCRSHKPKKRINIRRRRIQIIELPKFYEEQKIEAMARIKYILNIPINYEGHDDSNFIILN